jgi:hypothetical protein
MLAARAPQPRRRLAHYSSVTGKQAGKHTIRHRYAGHIIGHAHWEQKGPLVTATTEDTHQSGARQAHGIESGPARLGSIGTKARDAHVYQLGIMAKQRLIVDV